MECQSNPTICSMCDPTGEKYESIDHDKRPYDAADNTGKQACSQGILHKFKL